MTNQPFSSPLVSGFRCHVCATLGVDGVPGYETFYRVTSDCRPWPRGGRLGICRFCGCVQKVIDQTWETEVEKIYAAYAIYHQSGGVEQSVFADSSGQALARSDRLLERLRAQVALPQMGRLLDVGCGNGALLRTFSQRVPGWWLAGTELNDKYRMVVERIDRVEALYTCAPEQVPGDFDLITMVHILEHIPAPGDFLARLARKLKPGGQLLVEIPDHLQNPFDLLIADHCTHYTAATAAALIQSAGYEVISVATDWVPKELTVVACKTEHQQKSRTQVSAAHSFDSPVRSLQWLQSVVATARELSTTGAFGLFGTSIAATWLFGELEGSVSFFVDEDPHRAGKTYMGRPIYHPDEIPSNSHVYIALPTRLAESVKRRVAKSGVTFHLPPPHECSHFPGP